MQPKAIKLLKTRRFLPLFLTQFLGVFNDNFYRNALVILVAYKIIDVWGDDVQTMVTLIGALFIFPVLIFSAIAGQLADRFEKSSLLKIVKFMEIVVAAFVIFGFIYNHAGVLIAALTLLATQYAFFGPVKYSILPSLLHKGELVQGNGLIEASTFIAILLGTVFGGAFALIARQHTLLIGVVIALVAIVGWLISLQVPKAGVASPKLKINPNIFSETLNIINYSRSDRTLFLAILGISWFFLIGSALLMQLPNLVPNVLHASASIVTLFLATFTVGIAVGALLCNRLLHNKLNNSYVPLGIFGMSLFLFDFVFAAHHFAEYTAQLAQPVNLGYVFSHFQGYRMTFDLFLMAIFGGLYIVPLYVTLQVTGSKTHISRVIASNNIINALFMVIGAGLVGFLLASGVGLLKIFVLLALLNTAVAIYICGLIPEAVIKTFVKWLLKVFYKVEVNGLENIKKAGKRTLIIANHTSFLDALLLAAFLPQKLTFAINRLTAEQFWVKMLLNMVDTFPIDPTNSMAAKTLIEMLEKDKPIMIFPEGRITVTGALMKVYEGPGLIADKARAPILPVRIDGAQYSRFSRLKGRVKLRSFPKITITILPPQRFEIDNKLKGRERRKVLGKKLYDIMTNMLFQSGNYQQTVFKKLLETTHVYGRKRIAFEDAEREPITYKRFILNSFVLGKQFVKFTKPGEHVGLLLPNTIAACVSFYGLQAYGRVPAMLNFTAGSRNIISAIQVAAIKLAVTSRRFVELGKLEHIIEAIEPHVKIIYLEDIREKINGFDKISGAIKSLLPGWSYKRNAPNVLPQSIAVILFTSGSEGKPKGVALSHVNLLANAAQTCASVDFSSMDTVFNCLPIFHAFGLLGGLILPLSYGLKCFLYPSPLHYRIIPELVYDVNATMMFGTDTFLAGYAQFAHPYDFYSMRYVFAGAEKLKDETRKIWSEKFGVRVFEGYGTTETAPIISSNTPMHNHLGTVGRIFPGMDYYVKPVAGIAEGGELHVKGPNVMLGYFKADKPGVLQRHTEEWYNTGDVVKVDEDDYVTILGRTKRFAKIAGEMVSLTAVEMFVVENWKEDQHAVIALSDPKKGEQLILLTTAKIAREELVKLAKQQGLTELMVPKEICQVKEIPLLGSGKTDYVAAKELAQTLFQENS